MRLLVISSKSVELESLLMARRGRKSQTKVQNVRMVPLDEGARAVKVERQLAALNESQSTTRICIQDQFPVGTSATAQVTPYGVTNIKGTDDFAAMLQQYQKYRIVAMRFDIYDIQPSNVSAGFWATFHGTDPPAPTEVYDLPDCAMVPPGTGKLTLYWYPNGPLEKGWWNVDDTTTLNQFVGGLAINIPATAAGTKWNVLVRAIVDFRARR